MTARLLWLALALCCPLVIAAAQPQSAPPPAAVVGSDSSQPLAPVTKDCATPGVLIAQDAPLPNVAKALRERRKITILAIGGTSHIDRGRRDGGYLSVVEQFLEKTFKGLDVTIVNRGVSGELARDAAERIKMEIALNPAELVLWQLGTADALAQLPIDDFKAATVDAIDWMKDHNVDVALIGIRYAKTLTKDPHYQAIRKSIKEVAQDKHILRISRYEAVEVLQAIHAKQGEPLSDPELTETSYHCMSQHLARAIAAGLFLKKKGSAATR